MSILALDLGTTTGWACRIDLLGDTITGSKCFKPARFEGGGMRYVRFRAWLADLKTRLDVNQIYFEEVRRHAGTTAAHVYGGFMATLEAWCEENTVPYEGVPVGEIKKFWTGKGNADKVAMIAEAHERGYAPVDDNEADAIAILNLKTGGRRHE